MDHSLDALIERAREYRQRNGFSREEEDRQVRSFAYGNTRLENDGITMRDIDNAMESLKTRIVNGLEEESLAKPQGRQEKR